MVCTSFSSSWDDWYSAPSTSHNHTVFYYRPALSRLKRKTRLMQTMDWQSYIERGLCVVVEIYLYIHNLFSAQLPDSYLRRKYTLKVADFATLIQNIMRPSSQTERRLCHKVLQWWNVELSVTTWRVTCAQPADDMGKLLATAQPTRSTPPFILLRSISE